MGGLLSGCCCFFINLSKNDGDVMIYMSSCVVEEISHYDSLMRLLISGALRLGSRKERRSRCHLAEFFFQRERESKHTAGWQEFLTDRCQGVRALVTYDRNTPGLPAEKKRGRGKLLCHIFIFGRI